MSEYLVVLLSLLILSNHQSVGQKSKGTPIISKLDIGSEYYHPIHNNRDIQTISINALYGWERLKKAHFTFSTGITLAYAWGSITQLDDNFEDVTLNNKAVGIGPVFLIKYEPFIYKNFSVAPEFSGGLIFYSKKFPAGGDIYNFMWRMGGSANYRMPDDKYAFSLSVRWMHVSNGQGLSPKNPSYEGIGIGLTLIKYLSLQ